MEILMALEVETEFFNRNRAQWISEGHEKQWVVIQGNELLEFYSSLEGGYEAGAAKYGVGNFLLKQLTPDDRIETIQRVHWGASGREDAI